MSLFRPHPTQNLRVWPLLPDFLSCIRRSGAAAACGGDLWHSGVHHRATHARDRDSHGTRSAPHRCFSLGNRPRYAACLISTAFGLLAAAPLPRLSGRCCKDTGITALRFS
jgi:hypothetical protein